MIAHVALTYQVYIFDMPRNEPSVLRVPTIECGKKANAPPSLREARESGPVLPLSGLVVHAVLG